MKTTNCTLLIFALLISGCATTVDKESRNKDKTYDGVWQGTIAKTPAEYRTTNWRINCWDMAGSMVLRISDGIVTTKWRNFNKQGFINDKGKMKIIMPGVRELENKASNKGSIRGGINYVVAASLDETKGSGRLTAGFEEFANNGCSSKIAFVKDK